MKKLHIEFDCIVTDSIAQEILSAPCQNLENCFTEALEIYEKDSYLSNVKVTEPEKDIIKERKLNIAAMAMQGILSAPIDRDFIIDKTCDGIAEYAVRCANALTKYVELDTDK